MKSRQSLIGSLCASVLLLAVSVLLLTEHLWIVQDMRGSALPLAADVSSLERRADVLHAQKEVLVVQASKQSGSLEEQLRAYVLPEERDVRRLLGFFDVTRSLLENSGMARSFSAIELGDPVSVHLSDRDSSPGLAVTRQSLTFQATVSVEGASRFLSLVDLTGLLTVGDTLTQEEIHRLFALTEAENFGGITAVEQFLRTDLVSYARDPRAADDRLLKAFSSEQFLAAFRSILHTSRLEDARHVLGGSFGAALLRTAVWPGPFLVLDSVTWEQERGDWVKMSIVLQVYGRDS